MRDKITRRKEFQGIQMLNVTKTISANIEIMKDYDRVVLKRIEVNHDLKKSSRNGGKWVGTMDNCTGAVLRT